MKDLREYITRLEKEEEVQRIEKEVDWNLELGAIIRHSYDLRAAAPFFLNIKDYPQGYRLLGAPLGLSQKPNRRYARLAIALGMSPESSIREIVDSYARRKKQSIKPILVSDGPCKENIHLGKDVDLLEFPVPQLHGEDGGRYIGTWHLVATRDPDSDWVNWGMYRMMIHDQRTSAILITPHKHIGTYFTYEARNKPMEVAVAIGTDPLLSIMSAVLLPSGTSEVDVAGGIQGKPVELVKCETVDLAVPATSEIVLEGEVWPRERVEEGPFGEYTGYMTGERAPRTAMRVKAITHRDNPILTATCVGVPVDENGVLRPLADSDLLEDLQSRGFPVTTVYTPPEVGLFLCIVSTKIPFANYPRHLAAAVWASSRGRRAHFLVIVEDDVDATNLPEVLWALTTRCHPDRGIFKMPAMDGNPRIPFLNEYERGHDLAASVLFDCTWPKEWPKEAVPVKASFDVLWPKDIQEKVLKNWKEYGFQD